MAVDSGALNSANRRFGYPQALAIAAIAAIAGVPCAIAPGIVLEHDVTPKLVVLLYSTAGVLVYSNAWWKGAAVLLRSVPGRVFSALLGIQVVSLLVSTILSQQPQLSLAGSAWRRYGLVTQVSLAVLAFVCAALVVYRREALRRIHFAVACSSGLISTYAIGQYFGWDPFLPQNLYRIEMFGGLLRVPGTLGHAVYLGSFLAAAIPLTIGLATEAGGKRRLALWSIAGLSSAALILCGSRSSLVALAAGATVWILHLTLCSTKG